MEHARGGPRRVGSKDRGIDPRPIHRKYLLREHHRDRELALHHARERRVGKARRVDPPEPHQERKRLVHVRQGALQFSQIALGCTEPGQNVCAQPRVVEPPRRVESGLSEALCLLGAPLPEDDETLVGQRRRLAATIAEPLVVLAGPRKELGGAQQVPAPRVKQPEISQHACQAGAVVDRFEGLGGCEVGATRAFPLREKDRRRGDVD